jgi:hypothetical protein
VAAGEHGHIMAVLGNELSIFAPISRCTDLTGANRSSAIRCFRDWQQKAAQTFFLVAIRIFGERRDQFSGRNQRTIQIRENCRRQGRPSRP